jgi:DNA-binding FadR family transcriptional regulator
MIISGRFAPGTRRPSERELSVELGLSKNSLREAVKALEIVRVLDVRRAELQSVESHRKIAASGNSYIADWIDSLSGQTSRLRARRGIVGVERWPRPSKGRISS